MAHYAKVVNGIVDKVIVAEAEFFDTFVDDSPGIWLQTSYNTSGGKHYDQEGNEDGGTPTRKNYAGEGYIYSDELDAFYQPQPYPSWTFSNTTCLWSAPVTYPDDGKHYGWDEATTNWKETT